MKILLFLHSIQPLAAVVVNDNILVFESCWTHELYYNRALGFLHEIFTNHNTKEEVSSLLVESFSNIPLKRESSDYSLTGLTGYHKGFDPNFVGFLCFDGKLVIKERIEKPVVLTDLTYNEKSLDAEIELTAVEAVMIFSNLIVQQYLDGLLKPLSPNYDGYFPKELYDTGKTNKSIHSLAILRYIEDYLQFLAKQIQENDLSPLNVLRFGGVAPLILLSSIQPVKEFIQETISILRERPFSLYKDEKVLYFSLVVCLKEYVKLRFYDKSMFPNLLDLFEEKERLRTLMNYILPEEEPFCPEDLLE